MQTSKFSAGRQDSSSTLVYVDTSYSCQQMSLAQTQANVITGHHSPGQGCPYN